MNNNYILYGMMMVLLFGTLICVDNDIAFISLYNNKCMNLNIDSNIKYGNIVNLYECDGSDNQKWFYNLETREIFSFYNNKCLDLDISSNTLITYDCFSPNRGWDQKWEYDPVTKQMSCVYNDKCIDFDYSNLLSPSLMLSECDESETTQKWEYQQINSVVYDNAFVSTHNKCMDLDVSNNILNIHKCDGGNNQKWLYNDETKEIFSFYNNKCLDLDISSNTLITYDCFGPNRGWDQKWEYDSQTKQMKSLYNDKCVELDISNNILITSICDTYNNNQKWLYIATNKLVASNVCIEAKSYSQNIFNSPINGQLNGIILQHKSGYVNCAKGRENTNWGCMTSKGKVFAVQMIKQSDTTYYPTNSVDGLTSISSKTCANGKECSVGAYMMDNYDAQNSGIIELIDTTNPYDITRDDKFSLQYSEGCCGSSTSDNHGTVCVDVYFKYI